MNKEDDMKEVELNEMDQEKQPMTGETPTGTEKNGCVKVKVPEDTEVKFTGLSKEELMKVAGTAGWVRTRWVLLVLFWLSWIGMLAGAIVIIVQAPRCKPIPEMNWWNEGFLYQISDVNTFSENGLQGENKLDYLNQMKVKGLVLGPIHTVQADQLSTLELTSINPEFGSEGQLISLLDRAHRKGDLISLQLCWLHLPVQGKKTALHLVLSWMLGTMKASIRGNRFLHVLMVHNEPESCGFESQVRQGLSVGGVINQRFLPPSLPRLSLGWCLSGRTLGSPAVPVRLYQMLLFTLPGTPVFSAGDEIGLMAGVSRTLQEEHIAARNFFKTLTHLRGKERSLLHGEYVSLFSSPTSLAFVRLWDQSERFLTAVNWGNDPVTMNLIYRDLLSQAQVRLTTDAANLAAVLLSYPYAG
uniref:Solute carrier family 3 member 2a n=1 Tax=Sinocyclocheilus grahami TaxID=75366 RepID=A0A672RQL9_SINGR